MAPALGTIFWNHFVFMKSLIVGFGCQHCILLSHCFFGGAVCFVCGSSFLTLALLFSFRKSAAVTKCRSSRNFVHCRVWSVDPILRTFETFADLSALHQSKLKEQTNIAAILKMVLNFANIWWNWFASIFRAKAPTKKHKLN